MEGGGAACATKVFVYGTLRKGFHNHHLYMRSEHVRFVSSAHTVDQYALVVGRWPFLLRRPTHEKHSRTHISGELYEVTNADVKAQLDELEEGYEALVVKVKANDEIVEALVYFGDDMASKEPLEDLHHIPNGDLATFEHAKAYK